MLTIFKYPIEITDEQVIHVPAVHEFLSVQIQGGQLCIWAEVAADAATLSPVRVLVVGTGTLLSDMAGFEYLGTVQQFNGGLVWHVYVEGRG